MLMQPVHNLLTRSHPVSPLSSLAPMGMAVGGLLSEKLIAQARMVLSVTAYHWLHPAALAAPGKAIREFHQAVRHILAMGTPRSPFAKPMRRLKRKAQITRRALALRIGR